MAWHTSNIFSTKIYPISLSCISHSAISNRHSLGTEADQAHFHKLSSLHCKYAVHTALLCAIPQTQTYSYLSVSKYELHIGRQLTPVNIFNYLIELGKRHPVVVPVDLNLILVFIVNIVIA